MSNSKNSSRRDFLKRSAFSTLAAGLAPGLLPSQGQAKILSDKKLPSFSANDRIGLATIGMGIIGFIDTKTAVNVPGVELVAAADLYDGRLTRTKEVFGSDVYTTRDYREILERSDVDAVIVATPDHWHNKITIDALRAGKAVYCEKPMVQQIEEGQKVLEVEKETNGVLQVGSQYRSSVVYEKARELLKSGAIGKLNVVQAEINRISALGAWQYSIPPDASTETIDWDRFLKDTSSRAFDADRFFRWRKYWDYGTGIPGDLFVHRFTGLHTITESKGPDSVWATGGIRHWNDGREVPDVMLGLYNYPETSEHPEFTFSLQISLAAGGGAGPDFVFIGNEGAMTIKGDTVSVSRNVATDPSIDSLINGYNSAQTFAKPQREKLEKQYRKYRGVANEEKEPSDFDQSSTYKAPDGSNMRMNHFMNFFAAARGEEDTVEDGAFGLRAAAPSLLSNLSYREGRPYKWDPEQMQIVSEAT